MDTHTYPAGPVQTKWHRKGYVAAMDDIAMLLEQGADLAAIAQWVKDNGR